MVKSQEERKSEQIAAIATVVFHAAILLALFFVIAWRAPNPPLPEIGIQLNFGLDNQGSGPVQPKTQVGNPSPEPERNQVEPEPVPEQVVESKVEDVKPVTTPMESPVSVKDKKDEVKPIEKPKEKPVEPKKDPAPDQLATYKPNNTSSKTGETGSHGDDIGKTGDKGSKEGSLDATALYGKQGGGNGGSSLEISGWNWDVVPKPSVPENENGRIVFEIIVNGEGELERIVILENSLSPAAAKACREAVQKLTFSKTGTNVPALSKGKITFVARSN
jgi:protein TonB